MEMTRTLNLAGEAAAHTRGCGPVLPLGFAGTETQYRVASLRAKGEQKAYLEKLGFVEDSLVRVVSAMGQDPIVEVKGARVALGRQLAQKIMVREA